MRARHPTAALSRGRLGRWRKAIACLAIVATSCTLFAVVVNRTASAASSARAMKVAPTLAGLRLMNYYPADAGWTLMWSKWNPAGLASDFEAIARLHADAVRLFVSPAVFGWPVPSPVMLSRLRSTVALASAAHLKVELTIFDLWPDYDQIADSNTWATAVLTPYANDPEIAFVETRNEVNIYDGQEMAWLREQIPFDKRILQTVPVTASVTGSVSELASEKAALVAAGVDFLDWHYLSPSSPTTIYDRLLQARTIAGSMPLFIGEAGLATLSSASTTPAQADQDQLAFYQSLDWATRSLGLPDAAPWTLNDFTAAAIPAGIKSAKSPQEYHFGLRTTSGQLKPAGLLTSSFFATGLAPSVVDGEFAQQPGRPGAVWQVYHGSEGTFTHVPGVSKAGGSSLEISHSTGDPNGLPSYDTVLPLAPTPAAHTYNVSVWVKGAGQPSSAVTVVALAWFGSSGKWLGDTRSRALAGGTTAWTHLTAAGPAPAGAAKVMVYLQSSKNTGAAYFSDLSWAIT